MTAVALVSALRARGVELVAAGDRVRFRPASAVTSDERAALRRFKPEVLALLTGPLHADPNAPDPTTRLLAMPLGVFAREGRPMEVRVSWWPRDALVRPVCARRGDTLRRGNLAGKGLDG